MRLILSIAMAVTALGAASLQEREFAEGKRYYQEGEFGKAAARLDDLVNLVPARLTALVLVTAAWIYGAWGLAYDGAAAWDIAWRDGHKHASPNAGYPEAALAGALGVQVGGPSRYFGSVVEKPVLGDARQSLSPKRIPQSLVLLDTASVLALATFLIAACGL